MYYDTEVIVYCRNTRLVWVRLIRHVACCSVIRTPASSAAAFTSHVVTWTSSSCHDDGAWRSHGSSPRHVRAAGDAGSVAAYRRRLNGTYTGHTRPIIQISAISVRGPPTHRPLLSHLCIPFERMSPFTQGQSFCSSSTPVNFVPVIIKKRASLFIDIVCPSLRSSRIYPWVSTTVPNREQP